MKKPVIGLALGSGAAKGYAHIGVLQVLEKENIPIDIIVGSSMGSLIGALYASGIDANMLEKLSKQIHRKQWVDLVVPKVGLIAGDKIKAIIQLLTKNKSFEELNIKLGVIATDLISKESVLISKGNVAEAVRASIAIPGIFCPGVINGKPLFDGGVLERVPVKQAKLMGADIVIGVELGFSSTDKVNNIYDILFQTFDVMGREIQSLKRYECDILITPELSKIDYLAFNQVSSCILRGCEATEKVLPIIKQCIQDKENI